MEVAMTARLLQWSVFLGDPVKSIQQPFQQFDHLVCQGNLVNVQAAFDTIKPDKLRLNKS